VVTRSQLLELGYSPEAIRHRIDTGRLHPVWFGVYAIGRPQLTLYGRWMAAVLTCGPKAALSHESAGELLEILRLRGREICVSVPAGARIARPGIVTRRRALAPDDITRHRGIPLTSPVCTLIDLGTRLDRDRLEAAINEADKRDLIDPEALRASLDELTHRPGIVALRKTLDRRRFMLTDSELERRFLPMARRAGLSIPQAGRYVNGFKVDFYWPDLARRLSATPGP
jgi:hypothetical protein